MVVVMAPEAAQQDVDAVVVETATGNTLDADVHPGPGQALCRGDQAPVDVDVQAIANITAVLSPLMGRALTRPLTPGTPSLVG